MDDKLTLLETLAARAFSTDTHVLTNGDIRVLLKQQANEISDGGAVDTDILGAVLKIVENDNDFADNNELESYLVAVLRREPERAPRVVDALLVGFELGGKKSWVRASVLTTIVQEPDRSSTANTLQSAIDAFRSKESHLLALEEAALTRQEAGGESNPYLHDLFTLRIMERPAVAGESRERNRLYERYVKLQPETFFVDAYHPGEDDDVDAIEALAQLLAHGARIGGAGVTGDPNTPGFALASLSLFELSTYGEARTEKIVKALEALQLEDDALLVLSASILHNFNNTSWDKFAASETSKALLLPFSDLDARTPGQVMLRRLLLKLGMLEFDALPEDERPNIPTSLPTSLADVETIMTERDIYGGGRLRGTSDDGWPLPLRELFKHREVAYLLGTSPQDIPRLIERLAALLEGHQATSAADVLNLVYKNEIVASIPREGLFPIVAALGGEILVVSTALVSPEGQWAILRIGRKTAHKVELAAISIGELGARKAIDKWANGEGVGHLVAELLSPPKPPTWMRTKPSE